MPEVVVHVVFDEPPPTVVAEARVIVEDVSTADAPAARLGEQRVLEAGPEALRTVVVPVPDPDPGASYAVRVHVDVDGRGTISEGDFVSVESHPVLTRGHRDEVTVPVRRVG